MATEGAAKSRFSAVVLAAGAGRRFGGGKLLAAWRGGCVLDGSLSAALAAPVDQVALVWGADARVPEAGRAFARRQGCVERLVMIEAADHALGLSASLKTGLASLPTDCAGIYVFLGDMPRIPHAVLAPLADLVASGAPAAAPWFGGRRGHPVLLGCGLFGALERLEGDAGAGALLSRLGDALAVTPAPDDGVLCDIDRPEDLV